MRIIFLLLTILLNTSLFGQKEVNVSLVKTINQKEKKVFSEINNPAINIKSDTIIIPKGNMAFLIYPGENTIDSLKKQLGDDFYTVADDANFYDAKVMECFDSLNIPYCNIESTRSIIIKKEGKKMLQVKNTDATLFWFIVLYNFDENSYKVLNTVDFTCSKELF